MVELYERGQIVIPKYIRDLLHLQPGAEMHIKVEQSRIILEPASSFMEEFERLTSRGRSSDAETERKMKIAEKKMHEDWEHVH